MTKRQLSRHQRDRRLQRIAKLSFVGVLALVVVVVALGYWREIIAPGGDAILTVRGVPVTTGTFAKVFGYRQYQVDQQMANLQAFAAQANSSDSNAALTQQFVQQQLQQLQQERANLEGQTLEQLVDDQLIVQEAARRGITVSDADVDDAILKEYSPLPASDETATHEQEAASTPSPDATAQPSPTPVATPQPTPTPITQQQALANKRQELGKVGLLSETEYRELIVKPSIFRDRLDTMLVDAVPSSAEQVWARHILVDSEDQAKDLLAQLQGGADFAALAKYLSTDTGSKDRGGDLGWFPRKAMVAEFDDAAFSLQVGQVVTAPVKTVYGYHIIQSLGQEQNRPLAEDQLARAKSSALDSWLQAQRSDDPKAIEYGYSWTRVSWARNWIAQNAKYLQAAPRK